MSTNTQQSGQPGSLMTSGLPVSQLESLRFKANQIIDSIQTLQRTIEAGHMAVMPAWPDILSKYNVLLSQTHSFSMGLTGALSAPTGPSNTQNSRSASSGNALERVALHPSAPLTDVQLDGEVIPLLRNQQTTDVLRVENETVRRLSEHMATKGSLGVLGLSSPGNAPTARFGLSLSSKKLVEYEDVLRECDEIRSAHDQRVERAIRAVLMLKDRFEWRARVEVEVEEPEELEWDPRLHPQPIDDQIDEGDGDENGDEGPDQMGEGDITQEPENDGSSDGEEVQALMDTAMDIVSPISGVLVTGDEVAADSRTENDTILSVNNQLT